VRRPEDHLVVVTPNWHLLRTSLDIGTTTSGEKTWRPSWGRDSQLTPFKVQLGYRHSHKWWEYLKTILGSWPPTNTFQGPSWVSARPQVVRKLEDHLGVVTPNWYLSRSSLGVDMAISGENTWRPSWGSDPQLTPFRVQLWYRHGHKWWKDLELTSKDFGQAFFLTPLFLLLSKVLFIYFFLLFFPDPFFTSNANKLFWFSPYVGCQVRPASKSSNEAVDITNPL